MTMNPVVLITGTNGGLGAALVDYFLSHGHTNIACHFRTSSDAIKEVLNKHRLPLDKHLFQAELTDESQVANLRAEVEAKLGGVYGLLNLAGGSTNALSWKMSTADFMNVIQQNLLSTFLCCREFIPAMRANQTGRIINISSIVANTGSAGAAHYSAAKAGIIGLTKSLALELAPKNITVNALALGYFNYGLIHHLSEQIQTAVKSKIPVGRFGTINEIGGMLKCLLSLDSAYTTGQVLHLNGGLYSC